MASCPEPGLASASTLGLHLVPNPTPGGDIRVELAMVTGEESLGLAAHAVASAAFSVIRSGWQAQPGAVFLDLTRENQPGAVIPHVLWVAPFLWPALGSVDVGSDVQAHWLLGVPLFESERQHLLKVGLDAFEREMEDADLAYFDVGRPPFA